MTDSVLRTAAEHAIRFRESLATRKVAAREGLDALRRSLGGELPERGLPAVQVIDELVARADPGIVASAGPRFFAFVLGSSSEVSVAADWLASAWNQNSGLAILSPALAAAEEAVSGWLLELFGLPRTAGVGFVTGCQMAHFTCLAAARGAVLRDAGWDVERDGLQGAPKLTVIVGDEAHVTVHRALRFLGLGDSSAVRVRSDAQGRLDPDALRAALDRAEGPTIVSAQAGNVNTGACDDLQAIARACRARAGTWLHVDGAFGLWAAAAPSRRHLVSGVELADSWATDAHKWLNVPYDSGIAIVASNEAHRRAMGSTAAYLVKSGAQDAVDKVPEFSRRARGFALWAQLRSLGRSGVAELVERSCALARRAAESFRQVPGVRVLNEVVLNQVLLQLPEVPGLDPAARVAELARRAQDDGTCFVAGSQWQGKAVLRFSVCGQITTEADIDASVRALARLLAEPGPQQPAR